MNGQIDIGIDCGRGRRRFDMSVSSEDEYCV